MNKNIYGIIFLAIIGIGLNSCKKENEKLYSNYSNYSNENCSAKFESIKKINIWYSYEDTLNILASDDFENAFEWTQITHDKVDTNRALIGDMFFGVETMP